MKKRYEIRTNDGHPVNTVYADNITRARVKLLKIYGCHAWEFKVNLDKGILEDAPKPDNYKDPEPIDR